MKKLIKLSAVLAAAMSLSGCIVVHAGSIEVEVEEERSLTLSTEGLNGFKINATAGFLIIQGQEGLASIQVDAEVFAEDKDYELSLEKKGDRAVLIADPGSSGWSSWNGDSPKINLTVTMPMALALKVKDGSGFLRISDINNKVAVDDGSGEMTLKNIGGDVSIEDGSGPIELRNITGNLEVVDGSGSLEIEDVKGRVEIEDGSGSIDVANVGGEIALEDGSGGIRIVNVQGHVTISDGSGGIKLDTLAQGVTILEAGSGDLVMDNVEGKITTR